MINTRVRPTKNGSVINADKLIHLDDVSDEQLLDLYGYVQAFTDLESLDDGASRDVLIENIKRELGESTRYYKEELK